MKRSDEWPNGPIATATSRAESLSVVLLAGFGMSRRHLEKYRHLYLQLGAGHCQSVVPGLTRMTIPRLCDRYARRLAVTLEATRRPLVLHVFSGSVWIFYSLIQFASEALRRRIVGVVFESTPLDVRSEQFGRFAAWYAGKPYHDGWARPFSLYRKLVGISRDWEVHNRRWMFDIPNWIQVLAIHSREDPVADAGYIERYLDALSGLGKSVCAVKLDSARHCLAIRDQRPAYQAAIDAWLARVGEAQFRPRMRLQ